MRPRKILALLHGSEKDIIIVFGLNVSLLNVPQFWNFDSTSEVNSYHLSTGCKGCTVKRFYVQTEFAWSVCKS